MWQKTFTALRDLALLGVGVWGIIHEELGPMPSVMTQIVYALIASSPGTLAAVWLGRSGGVGVTEPTESPSSPSPCPPSASGP